MTIRRGTTRAVVIYDWCAVKFPRLLGWRTFIMGLMSNMVKRSICKHPTPVQAMLIASILLVCGAWIFLLWKYPVNL